MSTPARLTTEILPDVLAEDRFLAQLWVNKGLLSVELAAARDSLVRPRALTNWDYIAGNALYGGFEQELLSALRVAGPGGSGTGGTGAPPDFLERLARDVAGARVKVTPASPEGRLLTLCATARMTAPEETEAVAIATQRLEWEALVAAAARGNVTLAVQHNLARLELDTTMPAPIAVLMATRARGIAARNARLVALVEELADLLRAEGIRCLFLKESALALSHFGNGRLRMMGDIDLLASPAEIERITALLESRGYRSSEVLWTKQHYRESHHHAAPLVRDDLGVKIEPHHAIATPQLPAGGVGLSDVVGAMAERAVRLDARSWCFTPADTLLHLCLDLFGGAFIGKMAQACDAREVVRQGGVDWPMLEETSRALAAEAHVAFALRLLSDLDAPVPREVIERLSGARRPPFAARPLRRFARRNLLGYVRSQARLTRPAEKLVCMTLLLPGGWIGRALFFLRRYLYVGYTEEGVGDLVKGTRPSTPRALARLLTLPVRALRRWTSSHRMP